MNNNFAFESKFYANHRVDADTTKCMAQLNQMILRYTDEFVDLPVDAALNGKLNGAIHLTSGEMEQYALEPGEPMASRTELDKLAAKKYILLYVDRCIRIYNGRPNSLINCAFASIVETMHHLDIISFDEAEAFLVSTLSDTKDK
ncbi:hypothetical protein [Vibrio cionasavignyae]|uniref:hypothetical protein n=1 Tax=Vibrio cionasavignyae TaxID=2910252 RepID=UPI003D0A4430